MFRSNTLNKPLSPRKTICRNGIFGSKVWNEARNATSTTPQHCGTSHYTYVLQCSWDLRGHKSGWGGQNHSFHQVMKRGDRGTGVQAPFSTCRCKQAVPERQAVPECTGISLLSPKAISHRSHKMGQGQAEKYSSAVSTPFFFSLKKAHQN